MSNNEFNSCSLMVFYTEKYGTLVCNIPLLPPGKMHIVIVYNTEHSMVRYGIQKEQANSSYPEQCMRECDLFLKYKSCIPLPSCNNLWNNPNF